MCCVLHNVCQINEDDYVDQDEIKEWILAQERNGERRQNNNVICKT